MLEVLKQALEALMELKQATFHPAKIFAYENTIISLRQAIAELEKQEPVVWMYQDKSTHEVRFQKNMRDFVDHSQTSEIPLYSEPLANHELQCVCGAVWCGDEMAHLPNKTFLTQRKPLTDDEADELVNRFARYELIRAVEQKHGIKE
jgi:hypothetical protein